MRWPSHSLALGLAGGILVAWIAVMMLLMRQAALQDDATGPMLAVFEPGTSSDDIFTHLIRADARPIRDTWLGFVWVVAGDEPGLAGRLRREGAVGVYAEMPFSPTLAGCFAYADGKAAEFFAIKP